MQQIWRWMVAVAYWISDAWRFWGALTVVVLVAFLSSQLAGSVDDRVRYCGLALQLLGIFTVVSGLRDKRRIFKRPSLLDHVRSWLSRCPQWEKQPHAFSMTMSGGGVVSGTAKVSHWRGTPPEAKVEDRLAVLEENIATLRAEQAETAVVRIKFT